MRRLGDAGDFVEKYPDDIRSVADHDLFVSFPDSLHAAALTHRYPEHSIAKADRTLFRS